MLRKVLKNLLLLLKLHEKAKLVESFILLTIHNLRWRNKPYREYYRHFIAKRRNSTTAWYAVGSTTKESWDSHGMVIFDYLLQNGLVEGHRFLDIGCGNLRVGLKVINYLDEGRYIGIDISPENIEDGKVFMNQLGLSQKNPRLYVNTDLTFTELAGVEFDLVLANSVFTHMVDIDIRECFSHIGNILSPNGRLFATFKNGEAKQSHKATTSFEYPKSFFEDICHENKLNLVFDDKMRHPHKQTMMIVSKP